MKPIIRKIQCKSAIGKCGFPGGGLAVNPYIGCGHNCVYCYARFMKRFTGHADEKWGGFVDARMNIAEILEKQLKNKYKKLAKNDPWKKQVIYLGTVTDPYQPVEKDFELTKRVLENLAVYDNPVSILTKSDLVLRDLDIIQNIKEVDVNFTINTMGERWASLVEQGAPTITKRFMAGEKLTDKGINVFMMMGPFWPFFTDADELLKRAVEVGVKRIFSESFNTVGGNWTGVEAVLKKHYPKLLPEMKSLVFDPKQFNDFYAEADQKLKSLSRSYKIPIETFFGMGHAGKFD